MRIVTRSFLRYLTRRRSLSILQLMGIACGVAAAVGMFYSSQTALVSFANTVDLMKGTATHTVQRQAGTIAEEILVFIMRDPAVSAFSPLLERRVLLSGGDMVSILGLDPLLDKDMRPAFMELSPAAGAALKEKLSFFTQERAVLIDAHLSDRLGLTTGDEISTDRGPLTVTGTFPNPAGEPLIVMDIGHLQKLLGLSGVIDRVDLILSDPAGFQSRLQPGFMLLASSRHKSALSDMFKAFRLNLEALSLLALFVGVLLIYNTASFAVVSRRKYAGILRALGARPGELALAFLTEIILLGSLGGLLGGLLGYALSHLFTSLISATISNLYFLLNTPSPSWSWRVIVYGMLLGCGASLGGALFPLRELLHTDPVKSLYGRYPLQNTKTGLRSKGAISGFAALAASTGFFLAAPAHPYLGFAGAFCLLMGACLLTGTVVVLCGPAFVRSASRLWGILGKIAGGAVVRNRSRTAVAIAAFMVALSMIIGLGSLIGSFRTSLIWWMESQLRGDMYISSPSLIPVPDGAHREIEAVPGIAGIDTYRNLPIVYRNSSVYLASVNAAALRQFTRFAWLKGGNENWDAVIGGAVIVSESFSNRFGVGAGDAIVLEGHNGPVSLTIAAVFYDYTTEHGLIMMDRSVYTRLYRDYTIDSLAIFLDPHASRTVVVEKIKAIASRWGLPVSYRHELHARVLKIFDTTFALTRSMRLLAMVVAFFGIAGALLTLFLERQREFGIYRALGFSTAQVAAITLLEGLGMGLISLLLSTVLGTVLAWVLIKVINFHSFNWTIFYYPQLMPYIVAGLTAILASLAATVYPIIKICRTYPHLQIREE